MWTWLLYLVCAIAAGYQLTAFLAEVIEELEDEAIVDALEARLGDWFAAHG